MKRGLRHLPAYRRGRRRVGIFGLGLAAVASLIWGQQATLASFVDQEYTAATFRAKTLDPITPSTSGHASSVDVAWNAAQGTWAPASYALSTASSSSGTGEYGIYSGTATSYTHDTTTAAPGTAALPFTAVSAGSTHACGIARGQAYCWGTSTTGALGGAASPARTPTLVAALANKLVTEISAGTSRSCAIADGQVYCWGTGVGATPTAVTGMPAGPSSLTSGGSQSCAVAAGNAYCWTGTLATQLAGGLANRTVASVSAGTNHACAVAEGMAFCWGTNTYGQVGDGTTTTRTVPTLAWNGELTGRAVSHVSAGNAHTCAIADGAAYCWGAGGSGRLGNGATANSSKPVAVSGISGTVTAIAAGFTHSCALAGGQVWCWGATPGNGAASNTTTASQLTSGTLSGRTVTVITAGNGFSCAAGAVPATCWGLGTSAQLGNGAQATSIAPVDATLTGPSCADGAVRRSDTSCSLVQGTDYYFRLAYAIGSWDGPPSAWVKGSTTIRPGAVASVSSRTQNSLSLQWDPASERAQAYGEYTLERSTVSSGGSAVTLGSTGATAWTDQGGFAFSRDFSKISAGGSHSCGIVDGDLYCWGANASGQLGLGDTTGRLAPTLVGGALANKTVITVTAGGSHTCALTSDDDLHCWGENGYGQVGVGSNTDQVTPQLVASDVSSVSAGTSHTCGIQAGIVYCWGYNSSGQLGLASYASQVFPQQVVNTTVFTNGSATAVSAGGSHTCVISSGAAYCWGLGTSGQLGNAASTSSNKAVKVSNGAMTNSGLSAITAGGTHTCAIKSGTAYCWGNDRSGQLGNNTNLTNVNTPATVATITGVSDLSAGKLHTCAISAGLAYCWGENSDGQIGIGTTTDARTPALVSARGALSSATASTISAGDTHSCLIADGAASCYGNATADGRLGIGSTSAVDLSVPTLVYPGARCATNQTLLGNGTCSLSSETTYFYRLTFTLDGKTTTVGEWAGLTTGS